MSDELDALKAERLIEENCLYLFKRNCPDKNKSDDHCLECCKERVGE